MPDDKDIALALQRKFYGDPQGLAQHLANICLNSTGVVREVFVFLDRFSTYDVGCRFLNLLSAATLLKLVNTKKGKEMCQMLLGWFLNPEPLNSDQPVCPGVDFVIELTRLKNAIDKASPNENENPYYTIDEGIVLEADALAVLNKIAPLYFAKVGEKFNVNSGTRDSYRQAEAMYDVYMSGDKTFSLYKNRKAVNELIAVIKKGESRTATIQKMTAIIQSYFEQNILMSGHQRAGAIDIDINGDTGIKQMTSAQQKIMMQIAAQVTGFPALLEKSPPHIHIKFK